MAVYLVTWDLNREGSNYASARIKFLNLLDTFTDNRKDSGLDSVRFISVSWNAEEIRDYLRTALDSNDTLFVTRIHPKSSERAGWMNEETWKWIESHE